jgi:hypothetical protein
MFVEAKAQLSWDVVRILRQPFLIESETRTGMTSRKGTVDSREGIICKSENGRQQFKGYG